LRGADRRRDHFADDIVLDRHAHRVDLCFDEVFPAGVSRRPPPFANLLGLELPSVARPRSGDCEVDGTQQLRDERAREAP
jgi:hypothetical protein